MDSIGANPYAFDLEEKNVPEQTGHVIKEARLEFNEILDLGSKHVTRIKSLWKFTNLTTLNLNNNAIKKIEGLGRLTNLVSLNLSFNHIEKIEGLESLKKLEELNLSNNRISVLENIDSLENLVSFNIANNSLKQLDEVMYLGKLKNLFTLNLSGNPLSEEDDYKLFITAFFPNIRYLDYRYLNSEIKKEAAVKFQIALQKLQLEEVETEKKAEALKTKQDELQLHMNAFVESLNGSSLFEQMLKDDPQANDLKSVPEIAAFMNTFKEKMTKLCVQLFEVGLVEHKRRQAEVNSFFSSNAKATTDIKQKEKQILEEFEEHLREIKRESAPTAQILTACKDEINRLQISLLTQEFQLISQIETMIRMFDITITEMIGNFSETAQDIFAQCRDLEVSSHEKLQEIVTATAEEVAKDSGVVDLSEDVTMLFLDKDMVMGALASAHENHLLAIRDRESQLINRANAWKTRLIERIQDKELKRNRMTLSHITTYVDYYREQVDTLFNR